MVNWREFLEEHWLELALILMAIGISVYFLWLLTSPIPVPPYP